MNKCFFFILSLLLLSSVSLGQGEELLSSFFITQNENQVIINFSILGGASCNGVLVERRLESETDFQLAGGISGVCGGSEFEEHYTVVDENPYLNEKNIYRLRLGNQGFSPEKSLIVVELVNDYKIYPQPAREQIFIQFNNPNQEQVRLSVYNLSGQAIIENRLFNESLIYIDGTNLTEGMYLFQLSFESNKLLTGKFIRS